MFDWLRKPRRTGPAPAPVPLVPRRAGGVDAAGLLGERLEAAGLPYSREGQRITLMPGLVLAPRLESIDTRDDGSFSTVTTLEVQHAALPRGLFEYQHGAAAEAVLAIGEGFDQWLQLDLPVLLDAISGAAQNCAVAEFDLPASVTHAALKRRVLLGPASHAAARAATVEEDHPFCACCLFTNSLEAFRPLLERDEFVAIRLFAARFEDGRAQADCRVNGRDFEPGVAALARYAGTWPARGFETRKQYVVIQSLR